MSRKTPATVLMRSLLFLVLALTVAGTALEDRYEDLLTLSGCILRQSSPLQPEGRSAHSNHRDG